MDGAWPGVHVKHLDVIDVEPLRAEIVSFVEAIRDSAPAVVPGEDGRRALALALRALERIEEHSEKVQVGAV
jgi:predicted dehydrogenase